MSEPGERLQKALAGAGLGSRREIEDWIRAGRVKVNGLVAELGCRVAPADRITVDGKPVRWTAQPQAARVLLYRKRVGELVTRDDPEGRRTVFRKLPEVEGGRWIAIGRLDINTSGLLLLTNSGELARRLTHPSFEIDREYAVRVLGEVDDAMLQRLRDGVELDDGLAGFEDIQRGVSEGANRWFNVVVRSGRNRMVRRLWESQGCQVSRLIRVRFGPVELGRGIKTGSYRELKEPELKALLGAVGMQPVATPRPSRRPARSRPRR